MPETKSKGARKIITCDEKGARLARTMQAGPTSFG
jgi:hypothetical protein